jgi:hypothetical protein
VAALAEAAAHFGVEEVGAELQAVHAGWGTADAVIAAALPVVCALVLRWLAFAPDGTALGWPQMLTRPAFPGLSASPPWLAPTPVPSQSSPPWLAPAGRGAFARFSGTCTPAIPMVCWHGVNSFGISGVVLCLLCLLLTRTLPAPP